MASAYWTDLAFVLAAGVSAGYQEKRLVPECTRREREKRQDWDLHWKVASLESHSEDEGQP